MDFHDRVKVRSLHAHILSRDEALSEKDIVLGLFLDVCMFYMRWT